MIYTCLGIYFNGRESEEETDSKLEEWTTAKQCVNNDLVKWLMTYDPTAGNMKGGLKLAKYLSGMCFFSFTLK